MRKKNLALIAILLIMASGTFAGLLFETPFFSKYNEPIMFYSIDCFLYLVGDIMLLYIWGGFRSLSLFFMIMTVESFLWLLPYACIIEHWAN